MLYILRTVYRNMGSKKILELSTFYSWKYTLRFDTAFFNKLYAQTELEEST